MLLVNVTGCAFLLRVRGGLAPPRYARACRRPRVLERERETFATLRRETDA